MDSHNTNYISLKLISKLFAQTEGRDKIMKIVQYLAKLRILFHVKQESKLKILVSNLSQTRKILRLVHFVEPLKEFKQILQKDTGYKNTEDRIQLVNALVSILNDISDDIVCLGKMSLIKDKIILRKAERFSALAWFLCIHIDLFENMKSLSRSYQDLQNSEDESVKGKEIAKLKMQLISFTKLLFDFGFCLYDVFHIERFMIGQVSCGLGAGILSTYKLILKSL
ncbi:hypothetical protein O9G_000983 [Rozella allomycis CSF55]|uniref:Peroxisomal biogenesis factor 11 domain-containing protein n=1 Tax=Rozella allomycis (strain CSF55) TaxID=988480 RepID=A0A075AS14_ROZAC|nr:hypothetical protein O9G_000983 [Rozella allomycis CSF55]|eukprot:EPZ31338.1 hypothetical protein O9G_000983 [Rozella allomycis CSF55]